MWGTAYAYEFTSTESELRQRAQDLEGHFFWVADLTNFQIGTGLPPNWLDQGSVFNETAELRWRREGEVYHVLVLSDHAVEGLTPLNGVWESTEECIMLQDLLEPRVRPSFDAYPNGQSRSRMRVKVFRCDGTIVWISLRGFLLE